MKLSHQAMGSIMMALQNSLFHQTDIVPVLEGFEFFLKEGELFVENPPVLNLTESPNTEEDTEEELLKFFTEEVDLGE
jgi:hypothetical protein